ncbi:PIN2/TERF1-interacting telomerase inhibitor 1 isoform X1 [Iris pallida]|uniref:PIN2/TERF1-interacting telomerase inhibitor 1 isoform X1 n=1 Tax=Iris pallida TaxID=29817 RepID=A0AAX6GT78_IRIPA|nr:PIN2/TERF1-interacting telomerase inhibitor 1 isoform X1 [Iris pallida]KAJ6831461.1 PIN2/TERF1-interacting telomerase inhibitor 1 isoform X1 [Iris pallida]
MADREEIASSSKALDSSNVGFQLLKKCGWKEGTGLGVLEQGRLEPLQAHVKKNKRGLGAEKVKQKIPSSDDSMPGKQNDNVPLQSRKKLKSVSKRIRKMQEEEERLKEKEFERAFYREFWPDNV